MVQTKLQTELKTKISITTIRHLMKHFLGLSFKKIYPLDPRANFLHSKQKRQLSSVYYMLSLADSTEIINIDESSLQTTNFQKTGWGERIKKLYSQ